MKTVKVLNRTIPAALSLLLLASCSGYSSDSVSIQAPIIESSAQRWDKLTMTGEVAGGRFDKKSVLTLDKEKKTLILSLPMAANAHIDGKQATFPLAKIAGAHLDLDPSEGGGSVVTLHVPLASLVDPNQFATPSKLPNGKDFPLVTGGKLPSESLVLTEFTVLAGRLNRQATGQSTGSGQMTATIYLGKNTVGFYITLPLNPLLEIDNPIRAPDGSQIWGSLHTYPSSCRTCKDGGVFTSVQLPTDLAHVIEENL